MINGHDILLLQKLGCLASQKELLDGMTRERKAPPPDISTLIDALDQSARVISRYIDAANCRVVLDPFPEEHLKTLSTFSRPSDTPSSWTDGVPRFTKTCRRRCSTQQVLSFPWTRSVFLSPVLGKENRGENAYRHA